MKAYILQISFNFISLLISFQFRQINFNSNQISFNFATWRILAKLINQFLLVFIPMNLLINWSETSISIVIVNIFQ